MARKTKTPPPTPEQVANDPSLRWYPYRRWELLWSDCHGGQRRFYGYEDGGMVCLGSHVMGVIDGPDGLVPALTVRRPTQQTPNEPACLHLPAGYLEATDAARLAAKSVQ